MFCAVVTEKKKSWFVHRRKRSVREAPVFCLLPPVAAPLVHGATVPNRPTTSNDPRLEQTMEPKSEFAGQQTNLMRNAAPSGSNIVLGRYLQSHLGKKNRMMVKGAQAEVMILCLFSLFQPLPQTAPHARWHLAGRTTVVRPASRRGREVQARLSEPLHTEYAGEDAQEFLTGTAEARQVHCFVSEVISATADDKASDTITPSHRHTMNRYYIFRPCPYTTATSTRRSKQP
jgi:hypothetical protein